MNRIVANIPRPDKGFWLLFLGVAVLAMLLTSQRVEVGDDLGYRFADTALHKGDGKPITDPGQIPAVQTSHFMNFNGRVIVHSLVQVFLLPACRVSYNVLNGLMFALVWVLACRLAGLPLRWRPALAMLMLLMLAMPAVGVIWFSLVSFSLNYLWPAAIALWLLLAMERNLDRRQGGRSVWWLLLALLCGAVQESFSFPLIGGLVFLAILRRSLRPLWWAVPIFIGALALLLAPGNYSHLSAGGGLAAAALAHKLASLGIDLLRTPIPYGCIVYVLVYRRIRRRDMLLWLIVASSLLLACISYTALRQLVFPSLLMLILAVRALYPLSREICYEKPGVRYLFYMFIPIFVMMLGVGIRSRQAVKASMESICDEIKGGEQYVFAYDNYPVLDKESSFWLSDDPMEEDLLHLVYDSNTLRALGRLNMPAPMKKVRPTVLPGERGSLNHIGAQYRRDNPGREGRFIPLEWDDVHAVVVLPLADTIPKIKRADGGRVHYTCAPVDTMLFIFLPQAEGNIDIE